MLLALAAYWELLRFDWTMGVAGFARIHRELAKGRRDAGEQQRSSVTVNEICQQFDLAAMLYPRPVRCLQRSVALVRLLRRHGHTAELVIGVRTEPFFSHAWVEVNHSILNDFSSYPARMLILDRV
jgi:hypothetical protein